MKQKKYSAFKAAVISSVIAMVVTYLFGQFITNKICQAAAMSRTVYVVTSGVKAFFSLLIAAVICYKAVYKRKVPVCVTVLFSLLAGVICGIVPSTSVYDMLVYGFGLPVDMRSIVHLVFLFLVFFLLGLVLFTVTKPAGASVKGAAAPVQPGKNAQYEAPSFPGYSMEDDNNH